MNKTLKLPLGLIILRKLTFPHKLGILERLYGMRLAKHDKCWVSASNNVTWKLDLNDPTHRWIVYGDYEGDVQMNWLRQWLKNGGVVVDSGANIGQMLLYMAPLPGVEVHACEPLPSALSWLKECLSNYPNWKVSVVNKGLSEIEKKLPIQVDGTKSTARMDWYIDKKNPSITIDVIPLDKYTSEHNIGRVRLWKLDVEGHELPALRGAERSLREKRIEAVLVEVSESTRYSVIEFLSTVGYETYSIRRQGKLTRCDIDSKGNENILALPGGLGVGGCH